MTLLLLLACPLAGAALIALVPFQKRPALGLGTAAATLGAAILVALDVAGGGAVTALGGVLRADALTAWMVVLIALVSTIAASDGLAALADVVTRRGFHPLVQLFVFSMLGAVTTDDMGVMWVAIEGTTLASVLLVNAERTRASVEASYKYLLICSVGIALAFVGTVLVHVAGVGVADPSGSALRWTALLAMAPALPPKVLGVAFVFLLVGYGTKAGIAPMHTWLPDAHSEAPAPISALMSGVLLSIGLYAILRFKVVIELSGHGDLADRLLIALGLASMAIGALSLWAPTNFKRLLAYSSIEHVGIVCLGLGFGGWWGIAGAVLHVANHALAKSVVFVLAGRIRAAYGTTEIAAVRGLVDTMPLTGRGFFLAMLALMGLPPFGLFVSEVMVFRAGFERGFPLAAVAGIVLAVVAFGGLLRAGQAMLYGVPARAVVERTGWRNAIPLAVALALLVLTGMAWPPGFGAALGSVVAIAGG